MRALVDTINSIDENSKKILFKHFDQNNVNIMSKNAQVLTDKINRITAEAEESDKYEINSDDMDSDSSGNMSENDEINKIQRIKNRINNNIDLVCSEEVSDINEDEDEDIFSPKTEVKSEKKGQGINILYQQEREDAGFAKKNDSESSVEESYAKPASVMVIPTTQEFEPHITNKKGDGFYTVV